MGNHRVVNIDVIRYRVLYLYLNRFYIYEKKIGTRQKQDDMFREWEHKLFSIFHPYFYNLFFFTEISCFPHFGCANEIGERNTDA